MGRPRVLTIGCLNVANENEDRDTYLKMIEAAFRLKRPIELSKHKFMIITSLSKPKDYNVSGIFARYTEIDPDLPWIDIRIMAATDDKTKRKITIPDNLRPNFVPFYFWFDAAHHKLFFEIKAPDGAISPREAERFFQRLFSQIELVRFGEVYVTLVSRSESIEQIVKGLELKRLTIEIRRPNPDDHGDLEREIRRRLRAQNAEAMTEELRAAAGQTLMPDKQTRALAQVATTNGEVSAAGKDENGVTVTRSTREFPAVETLHYDPDSISNEQAFNRAVQKFRIDR